MSGFPSTPNAPGGSFLPPEMRPVSAWYVCIEIRRCYHWIDLGHIRADRAARPAGMYWEAER